MSRALLAAVAAAAAIAAADASAPSLRTAQAPLGAAKSVNGQSVGGIDEVHGRSLQSGSPVVTVNAPALGSAADVTGSVSGLPSSPANFKLGILVSADGTTWWDKTHDYPAGVPNTNPIEGIMLSATGTFDIMGWVSDPNDKVATYIRVVLVPQSFSFLWPGYQVEGKAWPTNFFNPDTVTAITTVNRATGAVTTWLPSDGTGLPAIPNGAAPAASPSAPAAAASPAAPSPAAASPAAASPAAPSPAAPSPAAPSPAAPSPAAASPAAAASPSAASAEPSTAAQPSATANALPNGGDSSPSAAPSLSIATPSAAVQGNQTTSSGAGSSHATSAVLAGFAAVIVGAAMLA